MNVLKVYEYALQREEEGYRFFSAYAAKESHAGAAQASKKLAEEELQHITFIKNLLAAPDGMAEMAGPVEKGWFEERGRKEFLDQVLIESMIPDVGVLRTAYLIERDLSEFYEQAATKAEGRAKEAFIQIAKWERGHEAFFKELHDRIFEQYTQMPWGG